MLLPVMVAVAVVVVAVLPVIVEPVGYPEGLELEAHHASLSECLRDLVISVEWVYVMSCYVMVMNMLWIGYG